MTPGGRSGFVRGVGILFRGASPFTETLDKITRMTSSGPLPGGKIMHMSKEVCSIDLILDFSAALHAFLA